MIIANNSYLDTGAFTVPLREDSYCYTLDHLDLITETTSRTSETDFTTIFRQKLQTGNRPRD